MDLTIKLFHKKPSYNEAAQWDGTPASAAPIIDWILGHGGIARYVDEMPPTMHSVHCRCDGRGIIPGPQGSAVKCDETEPVGPKMPPRIVIEQGRDFDHAVALEGDWIVREGAAGFNIWPPKQFEQTFDLA